MPVEIRELVIRAVTTLEAEDAEPQKDAEGLPQARASLDETEAIVQECVRQVLKILEKKRDR